MKGNGDIEFLIIKKCVKFVFFNGYFMIIIHYIKKICRIKNVKNKQNISIYIYSYNQYIYRIYTRKVADSRTSQN